MVDGRRARRFPRTAAGAAARATLVVVLALVGCAPVHGEHAATTSGPQQRLGRLVFSDVRVLVPGEGQPGIVLGTVRNESDVSDVVFLSLPGGSVTAVVVEGGRTVVLGGEPQAAAVFSLSASSDASVELLVQSATYGSRTLVTAVTDDPATSVRPIAG
ncbi:hypothetical protein [Cellulomonas septica]|uniref:Lipoprotein n=1 Tax=Cellulomonas septica TaxID=285080 RepID=A0ABX1JUU5_9CELL|nr:hypothetical protein [Cellulomonas septica]NKY38064.1 hypothetical protein [Cellulomonas septica]